jgi:hypothetical protein
MISKPVAERRSVIAILLAVRKAIVPERKSLCVSVLAVLSGDFPELVGYREVVRKGSDRFFPGLLWFLIDRFFNFWIFLRR